MGEGAHSENEGEGSVRKLSLTVRERESGGRRAMGEPTISLGETGWHS